MTKEVSLLLVCMFAAFSTISVAGTTYASPQDEVDRGNIVDWVAPAFAGQAPSPIAGGPVTTNDLLLLRDLSALSVSPNGDWIAFAVSQADPASDDYVVRWFVTRTDGSSSPEPLGFDGGTPIRSLAGRIPNGYIPPEKAKWSPDGRRLAMRRKTGDHIELWVVDLERRSAARVFAGPAQVTGFAWSSPTEITFRTGLNPARFAADVADEGKHGWLLDERMPLYSARSPFPLAPDCIATGAADECERRTLAVAVGGQVRTATAAQAATLDRELRVSDRVSLPAGRVPRLVSDLAGNGVVAWTEADDATRAGSLRPLVRVHANVPARVRCDASACTGQLVREIGIARRGRSVWFLKRVSSTDDDEKGPLDQYALLEWRLDLGSVQTLLRTDDLLEGCEAIAETIFCKKSGPTQPAAIVAIDLETTSVRVIANPNPAFATKTFPHVEKIVHRDADGNGGFAYLVYPLHYAAGRKYPLVVTQYRASGLLRGGVGDEVPIYPLSSEDFFVLSTDAPSDLRSEAVLDNAEMMRRNSTNNWQMESYASFINGMLDDLIARGDVDSTRLAITGLSKGAEVVHYMLQRSDRFAAAIASAGAGDITWMAQLGDSPNRPVWMYGQGVDPASLIAAPGSHIAQNAWSQQPERLVTPLLVNTGAYELLWGFEGFSALKYARRPLEVRVFGDEGHFKYRPASRAGVYANNIMWLNYWLAGKVDENPSFAAQYRRWEQMRSPRQARRDR